MTEQELLVDCLRRLNRAEITYYLNCLARQLKKVQSLETSEAGIEID